MVIPRTPHLPTLDERFWMRLLTGGLSGGSSLGESSMAGSEPTSMVGSRLLYVIRRSLYQSWFRASSAPAGGSLEERTLH